MDQSSRGTSWPSGWGVARSADLQASHYSVAGENAAGSSQLERSQGREEVGKLANRVKINFEENHWSLGKLNPSMPSSCCANSWARSNRPWHPTTIPRGRS